MTHDSLGLFTAGSKHNYDVGSVNTAGAVASASSSDSDDESFSSGHMDVSTDQRFTVWTPGRLCYVFHGPWCP